MNSKGKSMRIELPELRLGERIDKLILNQVISLLIVLITINLAIDMSMFVILPKYIYTKIVIIDNI